MNKDQFILPKQSSQSSIESASKMQNEVLKAKMKNKEIHVKEVEKRYQLILKPTH